ncbi:SMI1/KNR4 family protein [Hahella sp. NBU794]|uniref:SMI1/KNR4 family protein n=1 Tax=Hahella sp. NBU794 TaxID=3422590 RepID=UPI003D6F5D75
MISEESKKIILDLWAAREPDITYPAASKSQIEEFEVACREIPEDYKWFLLNCGGGVIGSEWVDRIDELHSTHIKFDEECATENGWTIGNCFIIGWDGSGSPIAIDPDGRIIVEWEADSEIYQLASSLEEWLLNGLAPSNG